MDEDESPRNEIVENEHSRMSDAIEHTSALHKQDTKDQFVAKESPGMPVNKITHPSGDSQAGNTSPATDTSKVTSEAVEVPETVTFTVMFSKTKHVVSWPENSTVLTLKHHIHSLISVAPAMQKIMFKGLLKDTSTLQEVGISNGVKVMVIGSKLQDVISVNSGTSTTEVSSEEEKSDNSFSKQKSHAKIIGKGLPDDAMPGYMNGQEVLPSHPLKGMVNKHGNKVRITFKLENDQLWLGTKDRTEKIPLNSIKDVVAERIDGYPGYHLMAFQLGPTEQSRYWIYWIPSQYVEAIKDAVLGKWQAF